MYVSKIALARVVQKVTIPSSQRFIVRIRYAPQIATRKTSTSCTEMSKVRVERERKPGGDRQVEEHPDHLAHPANCAMS